MIEYKRVLCLLFGISLLLSTPVWSKTTEVVQNDSVFYDEAEAFRKHIPADLQHKQACAVRKALEGDFSALEAVRNSRSIEPQMPEGIVRTMLNDKMCLYRPTSKAGETLPVVVYLHGGGWAFGSINSCAKYCASLSLKGYAVLALNYSLSPDNAFPTAVNEVCETLAYIEAHADSLHVDSERVYIGGDSAGSNLAITATLKNASLGSHTPYIKGLILYYPVIYAYDDGSKSWTKYGQGYGLDAELMDAFNEAYAKDSPHHPLISPGHATNEALRNLPPVLLVAAERDILHDQGKEFAERLKALDVAVKYVCIPGSVHLFITVEGQPAAFVQAVQQAEDFITATQ